MSQDRPDAAELLEAVREFVETALPDLEGEHAFHARIAVNLLAILERELALGPASDAAERERLTALLGHDGDLDDLTRELARRIRNGSLDGTDEVVAHVRATVEEKLRIANPRYLAR